jgi:hypothetical protein
MSSISAKRFWRVIQVLWIFACVFVLVRTLVHRNLDSQEAEVLLMMLLSYPASLLSIWVCFDKFGWSPTNSLHETLLIWLLFLATGWLQWFVLIPSIVCRISRPRATKSSVIRKD